jgi:serine/threonine protein kinase
MKLDKRTLGTPIAEGGEGQIYIHKGTGKIMKIFKPVVDLDSKYKKIEILLQTMLPGIAIGPKDILHDAAGNFIGYTMEKLNEIEEFRALTNRKTLATYGIKIHNILQMLIDLRNALLELHSQNIFIGDLNDSNVVFTENFHPYILDTDSWSVGSYPCTVAMDAFKDPKLKGCNFNAGTDAYAFAILAFKSLTRLHPFGGNIKPDLDLIERMKRGLSVLNPKVKAIIPKIIDPWEYMHPGFLEDLHRIYDTGIRTVLTNSLTEFTSNLNWCSKHKNDYYGQYDKCPVCYTASLKPIKPVKVTAGEIKIVRLFSSTECKEMLSEELYISENNTIVHIPTGQETGIYFNKKTYYLSDGTLLYVTADNIHIGAATIPKLHNSRIVIMGNNTFYYITPGLGFSSCVYSQKGSAFYTDTHVAINNLFEVDSLGGYIVINMYDHKTVVEINGQFIELTEIMKPVNYGLHYDNVSKRWLFIYERSSGQFVTYIFEGTQTLYHDTNNKYAVPLDSLAFNNNTIYSAHECSIRGFNWVKNTYKDFQCDEVEEGATLKFKGKKIIVINQASVYEAG